ncbi:MAG: LysE family translocator [Parvularculaceae bacterium]
MMTPLFIAFLAAAALLTITPGLDTAFVLRTTAVDGARRGAAGAAGVILGCLSWALAVALGVGALVAASALAYSALKFAGAAYLCWLGVKLIATKRTFTPTAPKESSNAFLRGFLTNILNPKVGVFYISFLPQFTPADAAVGPYVMFLAFIHAAMGAVWFAMLIAATQPVTRVLQRPAVLQTIDRITGAMFISFALTLAFESRR